jgi:hypothetical protein
MLSAIVTNGDTAEVFFLIALIIFVIAAIMAWTVQTWWAVLVTAGLAFTAAGLLWL